MKVEGVPSLFAARVPSHVGYLTRRWCPFQLVFSYLNVEELPDSASAPAKKAHTFLCYSASQLGDSATCLGTYANMQGHIRM